MRKILALALALVFVLALLAACGDNGGSETPDPTETDPPNGPTETDAPNGPTETDPPPPDVPDVPPAVLQDPADPALFAVFTPLRDAFNFTDVDPDAPNARYITFMNRIGIINGTSNPTRAEPDREATFGGANPFNMAMAFTVAASAHSMLNGHVHDEASAAADEVNIVVAGMPNSGAYVAASDWSDSDVWWTDGWWNNALAYAQLVGLLDADFWIDLELEPADALLGWEMAIIFNSMLPENMLPTIREINEVDGMTADLPGFADVLNLMRAGVFNTDFTWSDEMSRNDVAVYMARLLNPAYRISG